MTDPQTAKTADQSWENEGGSLSEDYTQSLGITRHSSETYKVGGYNYTNLDHAIAQGERMKAAGGAK